MDVSDRVHDSRLFAINALAISMRQSGKTVCTGLCYGEPDYPPHEAILSGIVGAFRLGHVKYTQTSGVLDLRKAISVDLHKRKILNYEPEEIVVTAGGRPAICLSMQTLVGSGDEIILILPLWSAFKQISEFFGATVVPVTTTATTGYVPDIGQIRNAISSRTRVLVINNPCNPTGAVIPREKLEAIAAMLMEPEFAHVRVLSDEVYDMMNYTGKDIPSIASFPGMKERTIIVNSFSKSYSMTGLRLGYVAGPRNFVSCIQKLQGLYSHSPSSLIQWSGISALTDVPESWHKSNTENLLRKRDTVVSRLEKIPHVQCCRPEGAFYCYADLSYYITDSDKFSIDFLSETGVAFAPSADFGGSTVGVRISFAASDSDIDFAMNALEDYLTRGGSPRISS